MFQRWPKRDPHKHYYLVPNEVFNLGLSSREIAIYNYLLRLSLIHILKDKADELKEAGLWQEVRDRYLEKKDIYLSWQDHNHPSFVVYVEAVNEVYNRHFNRGGWYNVQSIF